MPKQGSGKDEGNNRTKHPAGPGDDASGVLTAGGALDKGFEQTAELSDDVQQTRQAGNPPQRARLRSGNGESVNARHPGGDRSREVKPECPESDAADEGRGRPFPRLFRADARGHAMAPKRAPNVVREDVSGPHHNKKVDQQKRTED